MENKPSKGIRIIGWFTLITNSFLFWDFLNFNSIPYLSSTIKPFGTIFYFIDEVIFLLQIITAIGLLKLKEWAKNLFLLLCVFNISLIFIEPIVVGRTFFITTDKYVEQYQSQLTQEQKQNYQKLEMILAEKTKRHPYTIEQKKKVENTASKMYIPYIVLFLIWYLFLIYYFIRPDIKKQFSGDSDPFPNK